MSLAARQIKNMEIEKMNNLNQQQQPIEFTDYYLNEFDLFDGENFITFNLVYVDIGRNTVTVAITDAGKIILSDYELCEDCSGNPYFEYGSLYTKIFLKILQRFELWNLR